MNSETLTSICTSHADFSDGSVEFPTYATSDDSRNPLFVTKDSMRSKAGLGVEEWLLEGYKKTGQKELTSVILLNMARSRFSTAPSSPDLPREKATNVSGIKHAEAPPPSLLAAEVGEIVAFLELILSHPPSQAGKRLRSGRDLAELLGVNRRKIQRAFDILVDKGVLVSSQGSGTYIRKVPLVDELPPRDLSFKGKGISVENILAGPGKAIVRNQAPARPQTLRLVFLADSSSLVPPNKTFLEGVRDRVEAEGHSLEVIIADARSDADATAKRLSSVQGDGIMLAAHFVPIFEKAFPRRKVPVVFIGSEKRATERNLAPLVRFNAEDALVRALDLLEAEGCKRIGLIGYWNESRGNYEKHLYEAHIKSLGLKFSSSELISLDATTAEEALRAMFSPKKRPEAVYIADDFVAQVIIPILREKLDLHPGKDLRIITLSNKGHELPSEVRWSRMEFNPFQAGRMAADSLLQGIRSAGEEICSFEYLANWLPGETHLVR